MLVVHPTSLCDVCLDPYLLSSEPAHSPHAIACGHIFCLACLRNLSPSACPLCRNAFQPDRVRKLHVAGPPERDGAPKGSIEEEATLLLQRVALVSGEDVPDVDIIDVVTQVEVWLANNATEDDSHRPLRAALAALQRFKALQERNEREYAEFCRVRRELKAYRRNAQEDAKTSRAVEESLLGRISEIERDHALEVSQEEQGFVRRTHVFQLSRLYAEIDALRGDPKPPYHETRASLAVAEKRRNPLGTALPDEDWAYARMTLKDLKGGPMKVVKSDNVLKLQWGTIRRQITPKINQLTQDSASITRITSQIFELIYPQQGISHPLYQASLSSLAKAILLQAEIEVTVKKKSAAPLALVTASLLEKLPAFPDILFAKLVQRSGGWPVPSVIPQSDADGTPWEEEERTKAMGYRMSNDEQETMEEYVTRVSAMMRVYFLVVTAPVVKPLDSMFRLPRYWTYLARMINDERLLSTAVAAQLLYVALDVGGVGAKHIWGKQWVKLLELLYEAATVGIGGKNDALLGGQTPEGNAARVRVQLEIENIIRSS